MSIEDLQKTYDKPDAPYRPIGRPGIEMVLLRVGHLLKVD